MALEPVTNLFQSAAQRLRRGAYIGATAIGVSLAALSPGMAQTTIPAALPAPVSTMTTQVCNAIHGQFIYLLKTYGNQHSRDFAYDFNAYLKNDCKGTGLQVRVLNKRDDASLFELQLLADGGGVPIEKTGLQIVLGNGMVRASRPATDKRSDIGRPVVADAK